MIPSSPPVAPRCYASELAPDEDFFLDGFAVECRGTARGTDDRTVDFPTDDRTVDCPVDERVPDAPVDERALDCPTADRADEGGLGAWSTDGRLGASAVLPDVARCFGFLLPASSGGGDAA